VIVLLGITMIGHPVNLIVGWCGRFLFFVPRQFSQGIGEWPENQILIPDWTIVLPQRLPKRPTNKTAI